ncbi:bifunctional 3'-5' exonuclease/DNA polymerase [Microbacterium kribbense]|uniref:DNA-directed DNA polymerase n=1 Tax=Microbacterium kribbense TaxID=433645 RepID=A0ABP7GMT1_9MICO
MVRLAPDGRELDRRVVGTAELAVHVAERQQAEPGARWVWHDTARRYPAMLDAGVRVGRCHDLRLCHAILSTSSSVARAADLRAATQWDAVAAPEGPTGDALFTLADDPAARSGPPEGIDEALAEFARQRAAIAGAADPRRLEILCAAESAGALIAAELRHAGLPWDAAVHEDILIAELGRRPAAGGLPARVAELAAAVRAQLRDPQANLDSPAKLLRSLHRIDIPARTTAKWELRDFDHPVIELLLEYKRLHRLLTANGWAWLAEWVHDGRFRPVYIPAGVVTGRWAASGGGALQIPRQLREAMRADSGWRLVVADVAQLEPRVLAAMARDLALAESARGHDLYAGIVERGAVAERHEAKVAMLGAMYGATTGDSGRLVPRLRRTYPRAMELVDAAARAGENGEQVSTWLGRTSPPASAGWRARQASAAGEGASAADRDRARRAAGDRGRFTRNFVVQGTAAEWALAWLGEVRARLARLDPVPTAEAAPRSGAAFARVPHLAFFLHDELIVHTPARHAEAVAEIVREAAQAAASLLFGDFPIDFPLDLHISRTGAKG